MVRFPTVVGRFSLLQKHLNRLRGPTSPIFNGYRRPFPGKHSGPGRKIDSHLHLMLSAPTRVHYTISDTFTFTSNKSVTCYRRSAVPYFLPRPWKRPTSDIMTFRAPYACQCVGNPQGYGVGQGTVCLKSTRYTSKIGVGQTNIFHCPSCSSVGIFTARNFNMNYFLNIFKVSWLRNVTVS